MVSQARSMRAYTNSEQVLCQPSSVEGIRPRPNCSRGRAEVVGRGPLFIVTAYNDSYIPGCSSCTAGAWRVHHPALHTTPGAYSSARRRNQRVHDLILPDASGFWREQRRLLTPLHGNPAARVKARRLSRRPPLLDLLRRGVGELACRQWNSHHHPACSGCGSQERQRSV